MKKILFAALIISAPVLANAQQKSSPDRAKRMPLTAQQRAEKQTARLDAIVSLSPEQRQKIQAENLRAAEAAQPHVEKIRAERSAMREIGKRRHEAYKNILTPEQLERLKAARKEHRQARGAEGRRALPHNRMDMERAPVQKQ